MDNEELEAYLRKHSLTGQMKEVHDAGAIVIHLIIVQPLRGLLLKILDMLGI